MSKSANGLSSDEERRYAQQRKKLQERLLKESAHDQTLGPILRRAFKASAAETDTVSPEQARRFRKAIKLIRQWMNEDSDYDEKVWPIVEEELNKGGMSCGELSDEDLVGYGHPRRTLSSAKGRKSPRR